MELRQLECFVAVVDEGTFTRAATRLHIVQSAVSTTIATLERELGAPLLLRTTRRVDPTQAGLELLPRARATLEAARDAVDAVHAVTAGLAGHLRIGTMSSLGVLDLPAMLGQFHRSHPAVSLHVVAAASDGGSPGLITAINQGRLDLAFVSLPGQLPADVHLRQVASTPLVLVVPSTHVLAGRAEVPIAELTDEPFVDFPLGYGNRAVTDRAFSDAGVHHHVAIEINDIEAGTDFVRHGLGVALLPEAALSAEGDLKILHVSGVDLEWPISLATPTDRTVGAAAQAFIQLVAPSPRPRCSRDG